MNINKFYRNDGSNSGAGGGLSLLEGVSNEQIQADLWGETAPAAAAPVVAKEGDVGYVAPVVEPVVGDELTIPGEKPELKEGEEGYVAPLKEGDAGYVAPVVPAAEEFDLPGHEKGVFSWKKAASEYGLPETVESYTDFIKSYDEKKTAEITEAVKAEQHQIELDKFTPTAQNAIKFLNAGGDIQSFLEPLKPLMELKGMSDDDLIAQDLLHQDWQPEMIEAELTRMKDAGEDKLEAYKLRMAIDRELNIRESEIVTQKETLVAAEKQRIEDTLKAEVLAIKTDLLSRKEFFETPISQKHVDYVMSKYEKGEYHESFKNSKDIAEFLLYKEFGAEGMKRLKAKAFEEGRGTYKAQLHNVAPIQQTGGVTGQAAPKTKSEGQVAGNNFEGANALLEWEKAHR